MIPRERLLRKYATVGSMLPVHWVLVVALGVADLAVSIYLASLNPVGGYDENWYLINSHRFAGNTALPYAVHRPPLLPMLLAIFGGYFRLLPALAHFGGTMLTFALLRRLVSPLAAIGGAVVFAVSVDLRFYGTMVLTEVPSILLLLCCLYLFAVGRSLWLGMGATLLVMMHWSLATFAPGVLIVYAVRGRWKDVKSFVIGAGVMVVPFIVVSAIAFGNPLRPLLTYLGGTSVTANDFWFYFREFPVVWWPLLIGSVAAIGWLATSRAGFRRGIGYDLCLLILVTMAGRLVLTQAIVDKGNRYLVPLIPLAVLLCVFALFQYGRRTRAVAWVGWPVLIFALMPGKAFLWKMHDFQVDSVHRLDDFQPYISSLDPDVAIYTDLNDLAVMGHTGHKAVGVESEVSHHHPRYERAFVRREEIPAGSFYLTFAPADAEILASVDSGRRGTLHLARWKRDSVFASRERE